MYVPFRHVCQQLVWTASRPERQKMALRATRCQPRCLNAFRHLGADGLQARLNHPLDLPSLAGPDQPQSVHRFERMRTARPPIASTVESVPAPAILRLLHPLRTTTPTRETFALYAGHRRTRRRSAAVASENTLQIGCGTPGPRGKLPVNYIMRLSHLFPSTKRHTSSCDHVAAL